MKDNNLFSNDKESYTYTLRTNLMKLFIENGIVANFNINWTLELTQNTLQDQFRKLRNHYESQQ
jgi:hypothetical protein